MFASVLKRIRVRYFFGEVDCVNLPLILTSSIELDQLHTALKRGYTMSSSETWVVFSSHGQKVQTFRGTQSMLQAQNYANMIGGTYHCTS